MQKGLGWCTLAVLHHPKRERPKVEEGRSSRRKICGYCQFAWHVRGLPPRTALCGSSSGTFDPFPAHVPLDSSPKLESFFCDITLYSFIGSTSRQLGKGYKFQSYMVHESG